MGQYDPKTDLPPLSNPTTTQRPAYGQAGLAPQSGVDIDGGTASSGGTATGTPDPMHRVVQGAHQTIDKLAQRAAPAVQRVQHGAERARETGDEWIENLRSTVREKPIASLTTALMFGVVVARLMR